MPFIPDAMYQHIVTKLDEKKVNSQERSAEARDGGKHKECEFFAGSKDAFEYALALVKQHAKD